MLKFSLPYASASILKDFYFLAHLLAVTEHTKRLHQKKKKELLLACIYASKFSRESRQTPKKTPKQQKQNKERKLLFVNKKVIKNLT